MRKINSLWFYIPPPVVAGLVIGAWQYWSRRPAEEVPEPEAPPTAAQSATRPDDGPKLPSPSPAVPSVQPPAPAAAVSEAPPAPVRNLAEAMALFPELANRIFPPERIAAWLQESDLLRRIVGVVDCLANGASPKGQMTFLAPKEPFQAERGADGYWRATAATSLRTRAMVETFCLANPQAMAAAYTRLEPVFDQLYQEAGYPDGRFRDALTKACQMILATPVPAEEAPLVQSGRMFFHADPKWEALPPAQKHVLRLGVREADRVQKKVRELAQALRLEGV
ncbi:MAG: DUF3014 domain-containing protein [Lentisphaeria bacterium]|nr:DUF3014 domain-containing protein [Lentisphaeria bacterium]